jgi:hypothetical protein
MKRKIIPPINNAIPTFRTFSKSASILFEKRNPKTFKWMPLEDADNLPNKCSYTVNNLKEGTDYDFRVIAVNAAPGSLALVINAPTMRIWALDEIGKNSVRPWTIPKKRASIMGQVSLKLCGSGLSAREV